MTVKPHILYLHGLGSGPRSQKGVLVRDYFSGQGHVVSLPSVTIPSLERLSPSAAIEEVQREIEARDSQNLVLIGSSFGAFIALHALNGMPQHKRAHVSKLILLAPALDPWDPQSQLLSPERERAWREKGSAPIYDIERGVEVPVHYRFVEELRAFDSKSVSVPVSTLIVHGSDDEVVSVNQSKEFAERHPAVVLEIVQDNHQLLKNPDKMLESIERFILSDSTDSR